MCCWENWCGRVWSVPFFANISWAAPAGSCSPYTDDAPFDPPYCRTIGFGAPWCSRKLFKKIDFLETLLHSPVWRTKSYWTRLTHTIDLTTISWMICQPLNNSLYLFHTVVEFFWRGSTPQTTTFVHSSANAYSPLCTSRLFAIV